MTEIFSHVLRDSSPRYVGTSVRRSVSRSVPLILFRRFLAFCADALVTFPSTAPAHPHATRVGVYPALLYFIIVFLFCLSSSVQGINERQKPVKTL